MRSTLTIFLILIGTTVFYGQEENSMKNFDPNFVHTVYFWLENPDNKEDCTSFEVSLRKFLDHSEYAKTKFIGKPPRASREVVDGSFTYSLSQPKHKQRIKKNRHIYCLLKSLIIFGQK